MKKADDKRKLNKQKGKLLYENMNAAQKGELLTGLLMLYNKKPEQQNLLPIMQMLMDSVPVGVPMKIDEADLELIKAAKEKKIQLEKKQVNMKTVILRMTDGKAFLPVFSRKQEVPKEFYDKYYWVQMPFKECAKLVKSMVGVDEIRINTYTQNLILPKEALESVLIVDQLRPADEKKPEAEAVKPETGETENE